MTTRTNVTLAAVVATVAGLALAAEVRAGADRIAFPENFAQGVLYTTVDRPDNKQFRELFTSRAAIDAAKKGEPLPNGTVITLVQYAAQLDPQGNPAKDANGRFIKTNTIVGYTVMEKRAGWGAEYPENVRNGDWEYRAFAANKTPNTNPTTACFNCHKPLDKQDFVWSYDKLKTTTQ
jgi:hypothetical protein